MTKWRRFWWALRYSMGVAGLRRAYISARRFARNRGVITRQQVRALERELAKVG